MMYDVEYYAIVLITIPVVQGDFVCLGCGAAATHLARKRQRRPESGNFLRAELCDSERRDQSWRDGRDDAIRGIAFFAEGGHSTKFGSSL